MSGGKARFDGLDTKTGEKRFKAVARTEYEVLQKLEKPFKAFEKGTSLEFQLSPTITAFSTKLSTFSPDFQDHTLASPDFLSNLSVDFARALKDLSAILVDLRRLSTLGDLPINLAHTSSGPVLTCRFPGCDAEIVSRLCDEVGIQRGMIKEDEAWEQDKEVEMALLFPLAPGSSGASEMWDEKGCDYFVQAPEQLEWRHMMSSREPLISTDELQSNVGNGSIISHKILQKPFNHTSNSPSGYESLRDSDFAEDDPYVCEELQARAIGGGSHDYDGLEGIYRFLNECQDTRK